MTFWASRNQEPAAQPVVPNGSGRSDASPAHDPAPEGLPPFVETMVKRLLGTVLPQLQPVIQQAEAVMADMRQTLGELKVNQEAVRAELERLRRNLESRKRDAATD